jgi:hypothetical protein
MEPNNSNKNLFRTAGIVLATAVIQAVVFCLMIGMPLPQFLSSRDAESLQFQQLPEQKRTQPVEALENPNPAPVAEPVAQKEKAPAKKRVKKESKESFEPIAQATPQPQPVIQTQPADHTKVLVVNFEKPRDEDKKDSKSSSEEKPKFVPASDKLAGVQADDSKTEATADVTETPADGDSSAAMESMEKSTPASN